MEGSGTRVNGIKESNCGNCVVGFQGNGQDEVAMDATTADRRYWLVIGI